MRMTHNEWQTKLKEKGLEKLDLAIRFDMDEKHLQKGIANRFHS